ncbi:hypothetical protein HPC49_29100 [Pyxidicoccus fallax]|uniref:Ankyrin repeat protein n=1 Tax=Pyxidicoccus fallax TaxID=394095 RepID=A0A848LDL4_9BACT|nr:ankyrin repeat domain-containing protein [Pyxidicoccus fallax]NMO16312.1 hypothetical protein [Pyxidicoccus fallax]NPC82263.1 hypothetical protein [Pyxidicoccus fallax]
MTDMALEALFKLIDEEGPLPAKLSPELLEGIKPGGSYKGFTALHLALFLGNLEAAARLHGAGASLEARNEKGQTPLLFLAERKEPSAEEGIAWLLQRGANANATMGSGANALHFAAQNAGFFPEHYVRIGRLLLDAGTRTEARTKAGRTPLHVAIPSHGVEFMRLLVERGADVNAQTETGVSPLHFVPVNYMRWRELDAERQGEEDLGLDADGIARRCIETLLELGARKDLKTSEGLTAYEFARQADMPEEIVQLLR